LTSLECGTPSSASWSSIVDSNRRAVAMAVARDVAQRTTDAARLSAALAAARRQTRFPESLYWVPFEVAQGDAGLALMCSYLDACLPDEGWDEVGHSYLTVAARGAERASQLPPGLFTGLSGLAFSTASLSRGGTRYRRLLTVLDETLAPNAAALGTSLRAARAPVSVGEFDVISGASGIGAHLLNRDPHRILLDVLRGLVSLAEPEAGQPRWMTSPDTLDDESVRLYPWGNLNCGLAHGLPGPLALLALALRHGVEVPGQTEALRRLAEWLVTHRADDGWGVNWPAVVPLPPPGAPEPDPTGLEPSRCAWCYGSPGVARALWLAGEALDDAELRKLAVEAMLAVLRRPVERRYIDSPTFCHGVAGLLQIVLRFAHDTGLPAFSEGAGELVDQLLAAYEPERPLGYASLEPGPNPVDRPGLLDGAPGVAMVLLAAATDTEPTWDRIFLLS